MHIPLIQLIFIAAGIVMAAFLVWLAIRFFRGSEDVFGNNQSGIPAVGRNSVDRPWQAPGSKREIFHVVDKETGRETVYNNLNELPPAIRSAIENRAGTNAQAQVVESGKFVFDIDGRHYEYDSLDDVPPELRRLVKDRMTAAGPDKTARMINLNINGKQYSFNSIDEVPEQFRKYLPPGLFE